MTESFNFEKAPKALQSGQAITGRDGVLAPVIKKLIEADLEEEITSTIFCTFFSGSLRRSVAL